MDGYDARVLKLTCNLCLFDETIDEGGVSRLVQGDHLHRKIALEVSIAGKHDNPHAPFPDMLKYTVSTVLHRINGTIGQIRTHTLRRVDSYFGFCVT